MTTIQDVRNAVVQLEEVGIASGMLPEGARLELHEGSATYGRSWRIQVSGLNNAYVYMPAPLVSYLGETKGEAWTALATMQNALHHGMRRSAEAFAAVAELTPAEFEVFRVLLADGQKPGDAMHAARALCALDAAEAVAA